MHRFSSLFAFLLVLTTLAVAATRQWSFDGEEFVRQVIADGKGGCAVVTFDTNSFPTLTWLDKKGQVRYQENWSDAIPVRIVTCSKKMLLYCVDVPPWEFVHVDKKGVVTTINDTPRDLDSGLLSSVIPVSRMADKKGFFAVSMDVMSGGQDLIRFSRK